jgi:hypothetical protein
MATHDDPRLEYARRLQLRREAVEFHERRHRRVGTLRLAAALVFFLVLWFAPWWAIVPLAVFVGMVIVHLRIAEAKRQAIKAVAFYEMGIARVEDRWIGKGQSTELMRDETHLYAADLDIFGKASLFELLCTARTRAGEETLAGWLAAPAGVAEILERQKGIQELRPRIDFREDLAIVGADIRPSMHLATMTNWGRGSSPLRIRWPRLVGGALTVFVLATLAAWSITGQAYWLSTYYYGLVAQGAFLLYFRPRVDRILEVAEWPSKYLDMLSKMLSKIEREKVDSTRLAELRQSLETGNVPPSRQIARLGQLIDKLNWQGLDIFVVLFFLVQAGVVIPFTLILLWKPQIAFAVEKWRTRFGPSIEHWLSVVGEFEAFCAIAAYAYEHPADPLPEIVGKGPLYEGDDLRHPLIPSAQCVPNSIRLGDALRLLVVSGSNMSGKSTLLRTIGVNAVLALAGAPVRARSLRLSPLAMGSTIRIQDSLQAGTSRFYSEIQRIRHIVDLAGGPLPVLFLLDEVLHGTNSHDRALGAEAIVRGLVKRGAIGLATTHDLALAAVATSLAPQAENVHFEDRMEGDKLVFDYRMRPGVVQRSNALALMRAVGLEVQVPR